MRLRRFFWWSFLLFTLLALLAAIVHYVISNTGDFSPWVSVLMTTALTAAVGMLFSFQLARILERLRYRVQMVAAGEKDVVVDISRNEILEIYEIAKAMDLISGRFKSQVRTAAQQAEELEAILSSMGEGLIVVDRDRRISHFNPAAEVIFKLQASEVKGQAIEQVIRSPKINEFIESSLSGKGGGESDLVVTATSPRHLRVHFSPLCDGEGQRFGVVLVMADVTRIRELEGMRKNFASNVSHELRTPLTSIQGFSETLLESNLDDPQIVRKFIGTIHKHAERLGKIVEDLLMLSRLEKEGDQSALEFKSEKLEDLFKTAVDLCLPRAEKKQIRVHIEISGELVVRCDRILLEQALVNLLDNAIRYSDEGSSIKIRGLYVDDYLCRIEVEDKGVGLSDKQISRIFERFYRVDKARSREQGGTGLGLSIVKHIVQAHRGRVGVSSQVGQGSLFWLELPR